MTDPYLPGANEQPSWVAPFIHEVKNFTGIGDDHDDQVDGFSHGYNAALDRGPSIFNVV
jgi:phage terminase large subunit-like protein